MAVLVATEHGQMPPFLEGTLPEFHQTHYSAPKDVEGLSLLKSVIEDPSNIPVRMGTTMLKGAMIATFIRGAMNYYKDGEKKIFYDRAKLNQVHFLRYMRVPFAYGAMAGLTWFLLNDLILCPHGKATYQKKMLAYSIAGGLLTSTLYHPLSFIYGSVFGLLAGSLKQQLTQPFYPANIQMTLKDVDQERRLKALRDDDESNLSMKLLMAEETNRLYAL